MIAETNGSLRKIKQNEKIIWIHIVIILQFFNVYDL